MGLDSIPGWVLKENTDILAQPIADIVNKSYCEACLPQSWKSTDVVPIPKEEPECDVNCHLQPISLTLIVSKVTEVYVVDNFVKPAVLQNVDPNQYGTIPSSSTVQALISMLHTWSKSTDGNGGTRRVMLFDFRKAFNLIDHHLLVQKLTRSTSDCGLRVLKDKCNVSTRRGESNYLDLRPYCPSSCSSSV